MTTNLVIIFIDTHEIKDLVFHVMIVILVRKVDELTISHELTPHQLYGKTKIDNLSHSHYRISSSEIPLN